MTLATTTPPAAPGAPFTRIEPLDALLEAHAPAIGRDWTPYRNHAYRVANLCLALAAARGARIDADSVARVGIAAALHDIGIWTEGTFDYLEPSIRVAVAHLARIGRAAWTAEISAMIEAHHKVTSSRARADWLVEPFRRADWIDVTFGIRSFGVPRREVRALYARWPEAGFHAMLVRLTLRRARRHPLSPLPMVRL